MAGLKEIRRRIASVSSTKQITRAMKLVSAAKLRRAQDAALGGRAFGERLVEIFSDLIGDLPADFQHPLLEARSEIKKRRLIVIGGERGLCGAYNASLLKAVVAEALKSTAAIEVLPIGGRIVRGVRRFGLTRVGEHEGLPESASDWPIDEITDSCVRDFTSGACDEVVVYYTKFISAMSQQVTREVLLPLAALGADAESRSADALRLVRYDPEPAAIAAKLLPMLLRTIVLQAALESKASEHAARMTAMESATNNASDLIDKLRLHYNRARQSTITTELIDIVGGAEAIK